MTLRALIVDDEPLARRRLRTLLKAEADLDGRRRV
jgi:DNA-binding LytR/AlgR family response regulator